MRDYPGSHTTFAKKHFEISAVDPSWIFTSQEGEITALSDLDGSIWLYSMLKLLHA